MVRGVCQRFGWNVMRCARFDLGELRKLIKLMGEIVAQGQLRRRDVVLRLVVGHPGLPACACRDACQRSIVLCALTLCTAITAGGEKGVCVEDHASTDAPGSSRSSDDWPERSV